MPRSMVDRLAGSFLPVAVALFLAMTICPAASAAQERSPAEHFARRNTYGVFVGFSDDSSHILIGIAQQRKLLNVGFTYERRLHLGNLVDWQYSVEVMPVALEADPLMRIVVNQSTPTVQTYTFNAGPAVTCSPFSEHYTGELSNGSTYSGTETATCAGHRWTYGEAISPLGFNWNFTPRRRMQPFFSAHGGTMFSRRAIPILGAASTNFTFDGGFGVEWFLSATRSMRAEYRVHHTSNGGTAMVNPGVDNGTFRVTYCFGR